MHSQKSENDAAEILWNLLIKQNDNPLGKGLRKYLV